MCKPYKLFNNICANGIPDNEIITWYSKVIINYHRDLQQLLVCGKLNIFLSTRERMNSKKGGEL